MAMLTDEEFRAWCQRNNIGQETEAYIQRLRQSEPERRVRSRASNVSGRYPSVKMGCSIQFESQHVELWGIYTMERDSDVLEMYDQPTRIQLHYHARSGRKTSPWHTPDFLVLRRNGAGFEEWKQAFLLDKLAISQPHRYQRHPQGGWKSPPGEQAAQVLGLSYRVLTSAEYLSATVLTSWDQVFLYRSAAEVPKTSGERQNGKEAIPLASRLLWDGRLWEAEVEATTVVLRPESGAVFALTLQHFQRLVNKGVIKPERLETPSPLRDSSSRHYSSLRSDLEWCLGCECIP